MSRALTIRRFHPGDELAFTPAPAFAREGAAMGMMMLDAPDHLVYTILAREDPDAEGAVAGIGGGFLMNGHWECWASLPQTRPRDWLALLLVADTVCELLNIAVRAPLFVWCRSSPGALRCCERVGFKVVRKVSNPTLGWYVRMMRKAV